MKNTSLRHRFTGFFLPVVLFVPLLGGYARAAEPEISLTVDGPDRVECFEKITLRIDIRQEFLNPYDPDEADLVVEITTPSAETVRLPAFYYQPFEYKTLRQNEREVDWCYPTGEARWMARFTPREPGFHQALAVLNGRVSTRRSTSVTLEGLKSDQPGFLGVSPQNPRHFSFSNGAGFFAVGQNLAFLSPGQYMTLFRAGQALEKMGQNGVNYARVWACAEDWAMAIESRQSAWGRGWNWDAPIVLPPGRESYTHDFLALRLDAGKTLKPEPVAPIALRPHTAYALRGLVMAEAKAVQLRVNGEAFETGKPGAWKPFAYTFTTGADQWWLEGLRFEAAGSDPLWLRDLSLREAAGGPELVPELDPDQPPRGRYSQRDSFWMDRILETAEKQGVYLQPVLLARDHYMAALEKDNTPEYQRAVRDAQNLLRYAAARWGYSTHIAAWEYFNEQNPELPNERFYRELGLYLEQVDPYRHLRTTSAWGPSPDDYRHETLDLANEHYYMRPVKAELWKDEVESIARVAGEFRGHAPAKPAVLAEFGLATDEWGQSPYFKQDRSGHLFHRSLWASAVSGLSGTALFWWWETIDQNQWYSHYRPLSLFMKEIPVAERDLRPFRATSRSGRSRVTGLADGAFACAWIDDASASWHAVVAEGHAPQPVRGEEMELPPLQPGRYTVHWWDTYNGTAIRDTEMEIGQGELWVPIPDFTFDIACRIAPAGP